MGNKSINTDMSASTDKIEIKKTEELNDINDSK